MTMLAACGGGTGGDPAPAPTRRVTVLPQRFAVSQHSASAAPDGTLVVAGGSRGLGLLSDAVDRMDTATGATRRIGTLAAGRALHLATPLLDGGVLICGGLVASGSARAAERLDLLSGGSTAAGAMSVPRLHHAAVRLGDGRVLVTGGRSSGEAAPSGISASGEVWSPWTGTFRRLDAPMQMGRAGHAMSLLPDGRVLVTGGYAAGARYTFAEVFDPATERFVAQPGDGPPRAHHTSHCAGGRVWLLGGEGAAPEDPMPRPLSGVLVFDPALGRFATATALREARSRHAGVATPDGGMLLFGGLGAAGVPIASAEEVRPGAAPRGLAGLDAGCELHTATLLADGGVLVVGGETPGGAYRCAVLRYD
ncbi:Kelch repeat-containing protein [Rubrivivax sp. RP6-9]|uniref:Kelch repeat-containing protein n=1 Tax=Rubrivivax sp. RP6-9 TaxID=3415750 RepID=UPI003CC66264